MKNLPYLLLSFISLQSCLAQDVPKVALSKEYESCCGVQPVEYTLADHSVFVPNVFTPNGDGINDLFHPFISGQIAEVQRFTILSAQGDTILFKRPTIVYDRLNQFGWDGRRDDGNYHRGKFRYGKIVVGLDEKVRIVEGEACSVLCEPAD
jgi:hypothetical protein